MLMRRFGPLGGGQLHLLSPSELTPTSSPFSVQCSHTSVPYFCMSARALFSPEGDRSHSSTSRSHRSCPQENACTSGRARSAAENRLFLRSRVMALAPNAKASLCGTDRPHRSGIRRGGRGGLPAEVVETSLIWRR